MRRFYLWLWIEACAAAGTPTVLAHLPNTAVHVAKVDAAGNIYLAGSQGDPAAMNSQDAFVAKLTPDGSTVVYSAKIGGSHFESAFSLDVDSTGAAYILGQTQSPD